MGKGELSWGWDELWDGESMGWDLIFHGIEWRNRYGDILHYKYSFHGIYSWLMIANSTGAIGAILMATIGY
jgi:hypothetical protein